MYKFIFQNDKGCPVFIDNKLVGIVTNVKKEIVTNVYHYGNYFNEIKNQLWL